MEVAGLVIGIIGIIPASIQFNDYVRRLANDIRHSSDQKTYKKAEIVYHLQIIELHSTVIERLDEQQQYALGFKIKVLENSLHELEAALKKLEQEPRKIVGPVAWALRRKDKVQEILDRISKERNDLALQLILLGSFFKPLEQETPSDAERILGFIDKSIISRAESAKSTALPDLQQQNLDNSGLSPIAGSDLQYKVSTTTLAFQIVEEISIVGVLDRDRTVRRFREIASVFHGDKREDRRFQTQVANISQCIGYVVLAQSVQLVCEVPMNYSTGDEQSRITSLRHLLSSRKNHSLNARLALARSVAKAVFYTHAYRYVHKDLRPANILLEMGGGGSDARPDDAFGRALLAGFGDARAEDGSSLRKSGPASLDDVNLYQHPSRVGRDVQPYTFLHDVYSLGVCLLELGLWTNFLDDKHNAMRKASPVERQRQLNRLAEKHLPKEMGHIYTGIVKKCLSGCDLGGFGEWSGAAQQTGDYVSLGREYCEEVLQGLDSIKI